jgi:hypothetical protein
VRRNSAMLVAALAAGMLSPAMRGDVRTLRLREEPSVPTIDYGGAGSAPSPNGGKRHYTAQDKRAARKRRNRLRARGHHRQAVR